MKSQRRNFLSRILGLGIIGLFAPQLALANWPKEVFSITNLDETIADITGGKSISETGVMLEAPRIAENGGQVRIEVKTNLKNVEVINILVEKNPVPLTSRFLIAEQAKPEIAVNVKVRETSNIIALVQADGKFYSASREVRVTAGGCD